MTVWCQVTDSKHVIVYLVYHLMFKVICNTDYSLQSICCCPRQDKLVVVGRKSSNDSEGLHMRTLFPFTPIESNGFSIDMYFLINTYTVHSASCSCTILW